MVYKLGNFKRRCIAFFMEAVSTFCFSSRNPLNSPEVIDLMMSYVTTEKQETKIMSPFPDYGVDPTPTVRSFLVQQLLKAKLVETCKLFSFIVKVQYNTEPSRGYSKVLAGIASQECIKDKISFQNI